MRIAWSSLKGPPLMEVGGSQWGFPVPMALKPGLRPLLGSPPHIHILPDLLFGPKPDKFRSRDYFKVLPFRYDGKQLKFCHLQVGIKFTHAITQTFTKQVLSINNSHGSFCSLNTSVDCVR